MKWRVVAPRIHSRELAERLVHFVRRNGFPDTYVEEEQRREPAPSVVFVHMCEGHVHAEDDRYGKLVERYGKDSIGVVAELAKKNQERKLMHEMLSSYGIPAETEQGRDLCLIARIAIALQRVEENAELAARYRDLE
jgi:hypothetical protein